MAESLLLLESLLVEVAGYVIFPEIMGLVVAEFTVLAFEMMVLILARGLLILGGRDKIRYFVCFRALKFLVVFSSSGAFSSNI